MPDETLEQAAQRLEIIAADLRRRYRNDACVLPIAAPNSIAAARLILDRLELELREDTVKDLLVEACDMLERNGFISEAREFRTKAGLQSGVE